MSVDPADTINFDENEPFDEELTEKRLGKDKFTHRQWVSLWFIVATYVTVIPNRAFIASISTTLKDDPDVDFDNSTYGLFAIIAGIAYAFGKLFNGLVIDGRYCFSFMNEIRAMLFFQVVSCVCVFFFSFGSDLTYFCLLAVPNAVVQAGTWPALAKLVFEMYVSSFFFVFCFVFNLLLCVPFFSRYVYVMYTSFFSFLLSFFFCFSFFQRFYSSPFIKTDLFFNLFFCVSFSLKVTHTNKQKRNFEMQMIMIWIIHNNINVN